jgi:hypothetical protein
MPTPYQDVVYVTRKRGHVTGVMLVVAIGLGTVCLAIAAVNRCRRSAWHRPSA